MLEEVRGLVEFPFPNQSGTTTIGQRDKGKGPATDRQSPAPARMTQRSRVNRPLAKFSRLCAGYAPRTVISFVVLMSSTFSIRPVNHFSF